MMKRFILAVVLYMNLKENYLVLHAINNTQLMLLWLFDPLNFPSETVKPIPSNTTFINKKAF